MIFKELIRWEKERQVRGKRTRQRRIKPAGDVDTIRITDRKENVLTVVLE